MSAVEKANKLKFDIFSCSNFPMFSVKYRQLWFTADHFYFYHRRQVWKTKQAPFRWNPRWVHIKKTIFLDLMLKTLIKGGMLRMLKMLLRMMIMMVLLMMMMRIGEGGDGLVRVSDAANLKPWACFLALKMPFLFLVAIQIFCCNKDVFLLLVNCRWDYNEIAFPFLISTALWAVL